jgi:hypothetical protein
MSDNDTQFHNDSPAVKARLERLEDLEQLRDLKALYARRVDENHRSPSHDAAVAAANLFTDDAVLDLGAAGRYEGRAQILNAFENIFPSVTAWSMHYIVSPLLHVTGSTATGTWYFLLYTQPKTNPPSPVITLQGIYEEKYVKTPNGWRFKEVKGIILMPAT